MKHCPIPDAWTGDEALAFVALLDGIVCAIWRAHACHFPPRAESSCFPCGSSPWSTRPSAPVYLSRSGFPPWVGVPTDGWWPLPSA